jgi:hypothetical protein
MRMEFYQELGVNADLQLDAEVVLRSPKVV